MAAIDSRPCRELRSLRGNRDNHTLRGAENVSSVARIPIE